MTFVAFWTRTTLRGRWRSLVSIAFLLGLLGGLALFALAGARRTQSAYRPGRGAASCGGAGTGTAGVPPSPKDTGWHPR